MYYYKREGDGQRVNLAESLADLYRELDARDLTWCNECNAAVEPVAHLHACGLVDHCHFCGRDLEQTEAQPIAPPESQFKHLLGKPVQIEYKPNNRSRTWRPSFSVKRYTEITYRWAITLALQEHWHDFRFR